MLFNILSLSLLASTVTAIPAYNTGFSNADTIHRDVAIIGGGSSGTYSAISLKDRNISTIVIETQDRLGGHTHTYIDPATSAPIDWGVVIFHNAPIVQNYFARFGIPLAPVDVTATKAVTYDFRSGNNVTGRQYSQLEVAAALQKYVEVISQWPQLDLGMFLPDPVPEDLTISMGEFATKHGIEAAIPTMSQFNPGLGDFLSVPVVENMRVVGLSLVQALQKGFVTTGNNSVLYSAAQAELLATQSVLLSSRVISTKRSNNSVSLVVNTPQGRKLVVAKKLLITIPAKPDYLEPFDLNANEKSIFSKFVNGAYYTSLMKNTGLPPNLTVFNKNQDTRYNFAIQPGVVLSQNTPNPNLHAVYYEGPRTPSSHPYSDAFVKSEIIAGIKKLQQVNPTMFPASEPEFVKFGSHTPFYLQVCKEEIKKGFYKELYALQGGRSTFFTGASWKGQDSTLLWKYTEGVVLPQLMASLSGK
jgi:hypothetical protein